MSILPVSNNEDSFIYCVGQSDDRITSFKRSMKNLGISAIPLLGRYAGQDERSFVSRMSDYNAISPWLDEEESILYIHSPDSHGHPRAVLKFLKDGKEVDLGRMFPVSHDEALSADAWTFDPGADSYFICKMVE